jgi:hypothetical protein
MTDSGMEIEMDYYLDFEMVSLKMTDLKKEIRMMMVTMKEKHSDYYLDFEMVSLKMTDLKKD